MLTYLFVLRRTFAELKTVKDWTKNEGRSSFICVNTIMTKTKVHTALLLFSRSARAEAQVKRLAPTRRKSFQVAKLLESRTKELVDQTGLPVFLIDEHLQSGGDFGSRFFSAFAYVFAQGFENVIAIGNDAPALSAALIRQGQKDLEAHDMVIGPASDGGVYFLGLSQKAFQSLDFNNLPWQTPWLFRALCAAANHLHWKADYPVVHDIDNPKELLFLRKQKKLPTRILKLLADILRELTQLSSFEIVYTNISNHRQICLRGPPEL